MVDRISPLRFLIILFLVVFSVLNGQKKKHICYDGIELSRLLDSLSAQYEVFFSYQASAIPADSVVSICGDYNNVNEVLTQLLDSTSFEILQSKDQFVIKTKRETSPAPLVELMGVVVDAETRQPLPSVHVGVVGSMLGTVTNNQGEYLLRLVGNQPAYELRFSTIGYEPKFFQLASVDTILDVALLAANVRLPEVKVMYAQADDVIRKFFTSFSNNYMQNAVVLSGFFRESIFQDQNLIQISEATIDLFKGGYDERESYERVRFVKGRKSRPPQVMSDMVFKLEGGPYHFSRIDVAKYWDFLPHEGQVTPFSYVFNGVDYEYGKMLFRIGFKPLGDDGDLKYEGELFFDSESYALVRIHFELTRKSLVKSRRLLIRKESRGIDARLLGARYVVSYRPLDGKWVLGSVTGLLQVKVKSRSNKVDALFTASSELVVNGIAPADRSRIRFNEGFKPNYQMYERIEAFDPDFWESSNIVLPDFLSKEVKE